MQLGKLRRRSYSFLERLSRGFNPGAMWDFIPQYPTMPVDNNMRRRYYKEFFQGFNSDAKHLQEYGQRIQEYIGTAWKKIREEEVSNT